MVKPEKARAVEDLIIKMMQTGQLRAKIEEAQLIQLLENINQQSTETKKIVYSRRRDSDDDDEDYNL